MLHSKSTVDGIGGTLKTPALRQVKVNSLSPHAKSNVEIAKDRNPDITIILVTSDEVKQM